MKVKLDKKDCQILELLQENCTLSTKNIAQKVGSPITTVYAKIKRLEALGVIKGYHAVLDNKKLSLGTTAMIFVTFLYDEGTDALSQREAASKIALMEQVQDVYVVTGDWDILIKVKAKNVDEVGNFVIDRLRKLHGVGKTYTMFVFDTRKESTKLDLSAAMPPEKKKFA